MTLLGDFQQYVTDTQSASLYATWAKDNCGKSAGGTPTSPTASSDLGKWFAFRDAILAGQRPSTPAMSTAYGRSLVDAGVEYLDATAVVFTVTISGTPKVGSTLLAVVA